MAALDRLRTCPLVKQHFIRRLQAALQSLSKNSRGGLNEHSGILKTAAAPIKKPLVDDTNCDKFLSPHTFFVVLVSENTVKQVRV